MTLGRGLAAALGFAALLAGGGCAGPTVAEARLEAPYSRAFDAAVRAVAPAPVERADAGAGTIETGFAEALSARTRGYA
ncbi:MAG TPA: hypothetical protein VHF22_04320, partial [Planctomycetota bacterium]|nr:hypothetical protein [Planctomycetota bacterium]